MNMLMIVFRESLEGDIKGMLSKHHVRDRQIAKQGGAKIPLRVFALPCELVV